MADYYLLLARRLSATENDPAKLRQLVYEVARPALGGQAYDFVIAGAVTDPARCVEGVETVHGPVFYDCRSQ
jgi:hypothetical protein